jgi:hypothetical protein
VATIVIQRDLAIGLSWYCGGGGGKDRNETLCATTEPTYEVQCAIAWKAFFCRSTNFLKTFSLNQLPIVKLVIADSYHSHANRRILKSVIRIILIVFRSLRPLQKPPKSKCSPTAA